MAISFDKKIQGVFQRVFIGIDGGGTKTNVSVLDTEGRLIFSDSFGPSNLLNGADFDDNLSILFKDICSSLKDSFRGKTLLNISAGFAGTSSNNPEVKFRSVQKKSCLGYDVALENLSIMSDALLALNAYFPNKPGLLLISGTGSICYGKDEDGKIFRTGGFGYLIDDGGSGLWFGKEAVKAALYSHHHYNEKSILEEMVFDYFRIKDPAEIYDIIYKSDSKTLISTAAELVFKAHEEECKIADKIIQKGAEELVYLVKNCSKLIKDKAPCVVLHGSVFKQEYLVELIKKKLIEYMNIYISDKRIDLEAANILLENYLRSKDL
ncbi:MAG: hypothetical protein KKD38_01010 [Candidatus Delongbacteria bacterium]|nr:hypothetical protein [Candidatus Delongbacteria bacterium]MCG2760962.1 hypothetical protein [Candidatus Delongbacteria bacterium]